MSSFKYLSIFKGVLMLIETPTRKSPRSSTDDILEGKWGIKTQAMRVHNMKLQQFIGKYCEVYYWKHGQGEAEENWTV